MLSYALTCIVWGDDPNNIFSVLFSKKSSIVDVKLKILNHLNLKKEMINKIKLYKIDEEIYTDDKRFNIMKNKEKYKIISPDQLFKISEVNDISLMIDSMNVENSFNTENLIGAVVLIDEVVNDTSDISNQQYEGYKTEKNKPVKKENIPNSFNELDNEFMNNNDEDENYNGDYEDDISEYDSRPSYRKFSSRNRKEKIKKQSQKRDKLKLNQIDNNKKEFCNCIKDNYCLFDQNKKKNPVISSNKIPTPTEDIICQDCNNSPNSRYIPNNITNDLPKKLKINNNHSSTPQSLQSNSSQHQNISNPIAMNITNNTNKIANANTSNPLDSPSKSLTKNQANKRVMHSSSSTVHIVNNDDLFRETKIECDIPELLHTKSIKVQGTSNNENKKQDTLTDNKNSYYSSKPFSLIDSNTNVKQNKDTPLNHILCNDSLSIEETIENSEENQFNIQFIDTTNPNRLSNSNSSFSQRDENYVFNSNNNNISTNSNDIHDNKSSPSPYTRRYYPDSDIEILELSNALKSLTPLENQINHEQLNYESPTISGDNNSGLSNLKFNSNHNSLDRPTEQANEVPTTSMLLRQPSISKSLVFNIDQFPSPPELGDESDITNILHSRQAQSELRKRDMILNHYYKSGDLNDLPPSYENINQQQSAQTISELNNNNNTLSTLLHDNVETPESSHEGSYYGNSNDSSSHHSSKIHYSCCAPCSNFDELIANKLNISTKLVRFLKFLFLSLLLLVSVLIVFIIIHLSQKSDQDNGLDCSIYTKTRLSTTISGTNTITKTLVHRLVTIQEKNPSPEPTPRSITSNTNEVDDFIIVSEGKGEDEGTIEWTIREVTDPYLITSYFKKSENKSQNLINRLASASFQLRLESIIEINDTIGINESESVYHLEASKENVNFAFLTNNDSKTNIDIFKFSEYFTDETRLLNITINYLFTSQSINVADPTNAILNPQSARCFLEIENWNYRYDNSNLLVKSSITSSDLVWSVKEENVINLNNSEGKIILKEGVRTSRNNTLQNAKLSLFEDVVEFEEDEGVVEVEFLISNPKKSKYLLADIEILLRSQILDISTKEYVNSVNSSVSSSSTKLQFNSLNFVKKLFNLTLFNNRYFSIKKLYNTRQMKILSIFINLLIQLIIFHI